MGVILRTAGAAPHQDRGQARLRISAAAVGDGARPDAEVDRADARLRGRLADQALDPRPLQQGHRRDRRRRRRRLPGSARLHAHADAEPCQEREALPRHAADLHALRHREPARRDVLADRAAALRRLHRHQPDRGAGRDRRQLRPRHARAPHRGHRAQDQLRGGRRGRAPAPAARPRRPDRHRLHRHGREAQQPHRRAAPEGRAASNDRARIQVGRISHFGLLEMSRQRIRTARARKLDREVPALRRHRPRALGLVGRAAAAARRSRRCCSRARPTTHRAHPHRDRALSCSTTSARICARSRSASASPSRSMPTRRSPARPSYIVESGEQVHSLEQAKAIAAQPIAAVPITDDDEGLFADDEAEETAEGESTPKSRTTTKHPTASSRRKPAMRAKSPNAKAASVKAAATVAGAAGGADAVAARATKPAKATSRQRPRRSAPRKVKVKTMAPWRRARMRRRSRPASTSDEPSDGDNGDGRRRRRGRRGGRRNRRGRDGDEPRMPGDEAAQFDGDHASGHSEHEPADRPAFERHESDAPRHDARHDDAPRHEERAPQTASFEAPPPAPAPTPVAAAPEPASPQEAAPRRRSTVRERAPVAVAADTAPEPASVSPPEPVDLPQPVVTGTSESEAAEQPRRSGWWRRR